MKASRYLPVVLLAALALPASAAAQAPAPAVTLQTSGTQTFERGQVSLAGLRVGATARATGALPGSTLTLTFTHAGRVLATVQKPVAGEGTATGSVASAPVGLVQVQARLAGPGETAPGAGKSSSAMVAVLQSSSRNGSRGAHVRFLQRRLADMGFAIRQTGVHDIYTAFAVVAHRKVMGLSRVGTASVAEYRAAFARRGRYVARYPGAGRHVEGDLKRQVLALVDRGGRVFRVYHTSSGRPAFRTPLGVHTFWMKEPGLNSRSMLHTVYFTHQVPGRRPACGIHGYFAVPTIAYSHCCFRVLLQDALFIHKWIHLGEKLYVYR
ncbi:MAG: hypothetical protein QOJ97_1668 [Solirubrobacteraceae bacterium]|jgi:hypothetical protein|nr:hypothetical protein [Solirubrobacteraceae bacterium]